MPVLVDAMPLTTAPKKLPAAPANPPLASPSALMLAVASVVSLSSAFSDAICVVH